MREPCLRLDEHWLLGTVRFVEDAGTARLLGHESADSVAAALGSQWSDNDGAYRDSPLLPLKQVSSRRKGAAMERITHRHLTEHGYTVKRSDSSQHDRRVDGYTVEIKGSFLWEDGTFRWQQIRVDQNYDYLICVAFYPDRIEYYACTHAVAARELKTLDADGFYPHNQHGGKTVDSGTYFIQGLPRDFPWLRPIAKVLPKPVSA